MSMSTKARVDRKTVPGITALSVSGYKSLSRRQRLEIRPLTILAGANSSGKSSVMQPILLLKQTREASYDPGPLLLNGTNVRFTTADQLLSRTAANTYADELHIGLETAPYGSVELVFKRPPRKSLDLDRMIFQEETKSIVLQQNMSKEEISEVVPEPLRHWETIQLQRGRRKVQWVLRRERCFFTVRLSVPGFPIGPPFPSYPFGIPDVSEHIQKIIHLPALRGNPERTYPTTAVGTKFPGTFQEYTASIVALWQTTNDRRLRRLQRALEKLGLTWTVSVQTLDETQVELQVGRLPHRSRAQKDGQVNVADVGYGVSQVLPVLVALFAASPGQLVYIEQPEIHLHPRAQTALAEVLADAAKRGVRVVVETHSDLLLLGLQTLVAEGNFAPELIKLHWFSRRKDGSTQIESADLDESGAFGEWPVDFGDVRQRVENQFLTAAESSIER